MQDRGGVPFVRGGDIASGQIRTEQLRTIAPEVSSQYKRTLLQGGELLVSLVGNPGQVAIVPDNLRGANIARQVGLVRLRKEVDAIFIKYFLSSPIGQAGLGAQTMGSVQQVINLRDLKEVRIPLPPLREQRAIAHILGTLDDNIELNRRMNETLEAMARALFRSWFVDFDPVRAKAAGHQPTGMDAATSKLFPSEFVESELGEIPDGWGVSQLDDLAAIHGGKQLTTVACQPIGPFPVFGANGIMGFADRTTHDGFVIAFGRVGAYCGSVHWTYSGAWINNNASSVVPKRWPEFVLQAMLMTEFDGMRTGSAQPFIPNSSMASLQVVCAPDQILDEFCAVVHSLRLKEHASHRESRTLAVLRDALLPKLISGELRLEQATRFMEKIGS
ncbi:MAG: restriction endonuclease subunit S [Deltaproteobacteria bacterium]|nr:restriction endonuclease subunit S [Deltaproteobacteria bacterium]